MTFTVQTFWDSLVEMAEKLVHPKERVMSIDDLLWSAFDLIYDADPQAFINNFYADDDGLFAVVVSNGKLFRTDITLENDEISISDLENWVEVEQKFDPVSQSKFTITRNAENGEFRWFSVSCSAVVNRSGEIDSCALMDSFIENIKETSEYPYRDFFHLGETYRTGQCDFVGRDGYLLVTSGIYDDTDLAKKEILARTTDPDYWGDSIEFKPTAEPDYLEFEGDVKIAVYNQGILRAISTLPEHLAAAWFTAETSLEEVTRMLNDTQMDAFVLLFDGDESAATKWLEDHTDPQNRAVDEEGKIARSADMEDEPVADAEADPNVEGEEVKAEKTEELETEDDDDDDDDKEVEDQVIEIEEPVMQEIVDQVAQAIDPTPALAEFKTSLEEVTLALRKTNTALDDALGRLAALELTEEEKQIEYQQDMPRRATQNIRVTRRPRIDNVQDAEVKKTSDEKAAVVLARIRPEQN